MNKKDILELKRRLKKEGCTFTKMRGCYVDSQKNIVLHMNETFLNLDEEEFYKYLEIAKKALSGTIGNNMLELSFLKEEDGTEAQKFFLGLRDSGLKADGLLDVLYERIIKEYEYAGKPLLRYSVPEWQLESKYFGTKSTSKYSPTSSLPKGKSPELFEAYFEVDVKISNEKMYVVSGYKKTHV